MRHLTLTWASVIWVMQGSFIITAARLLTSTAHLDEILERTQRCNDIPALGFAVVAGNRDAKNAFAKDLFYARNYGIRNDGPASLPSNHTLFCVGSITKHVTAIMILHLLELLRNRGHNYTISSLITDILPSLNLSNSALRHATIEDILSHRTGLAEYFGPFLVGNPQNTTRQKLAEMAAQLPRVHRNREGYLYNNLVFNVAGLVAEKLGEKLVNATITWEALVREFLFRPLGIVSSTGFSDMLGYRNNGVAKPFLSLMGKHRQLDPQIMQLINPAGPSGSLCISPEGMATWMRFILSRGRFRGVQIVSARTIEESWKPRIVQSTGTTGVDEARGVEGTVSSVRRAYALGWGTGTYRGFDYVGHGGGFYSYLSLLTIFPEVNISIFTSTSGPATLNLKSMMRTVHLNIFDRLMGYRYVLPYRFCEQQPLRVETPRGSSRRLNHEQYTGTYHHSVFGNLTISSFKDKLYLEIGRYGNASIHCWTSVTSCELKFHGMLWWISDSDAFHNDRETNRTILFEICGHHVGRMILPLYSTDVPPAFVWMPPEGSSDRTGCGVGAAIDDRHQPSPRTAAAKLALSTATKIDGLSVMIMSAVVGCLSSCLR